VSSRLTHANVHRDARALDEAAKIVTTLHDGFQTAAQTAR